MALHDNTWLTAERIVEGNWSMSVGEYIFSTADNRVLQSFWERGFIFSYLPLQTVNTYFTPQVEIVKFFNEICKNTPYAVLRPAPFFISFKLIC
jgi:hypothetical protein